MTIYRYNKFKLNINSVIKIVNNCISKDNISYVINLIDGIEYVDHFIVFALTSIAHDCVNSNKIKYGIQILNKLSKYNYEIDLNDYQDQDYICEYFSIDQKIINLISRTSLILTNKNRIKDAVHVAKLIKNEIEEAITITKISQYCIENNNLKETIELLNLSYNYEYYPDYWNPDAKKDEWETITNDTYDKIANYLWHHRESLVDEIISTHQSVARSKTLSRLADKYRKNRQNDEALKLYNLFINEGNSSSWTIRHINEIAIYYIETEEFEKALDIIMETLDVVVPEIHLGWCDLPRELEKLFKRTNSHKIKEKFLPVLLRLLENDMTHDEVTIVVTLINYIDDIIKLHRVDEAKILLEKSRLYLSKTDVFSKLVLTSIAKRFWKLGEYRHFIKTLNSFKK